MTIMQAAYEKARANRLRVVFPEIGKNYRIEAAAMQLSAEGLVEPVGLKQPDEAQLAALLANGQMKEEVARSMLEKPLIRAAAMVAAGQADILVSGASVPSHQVIEAASMAIGMADGVKVASAFFLMVFPDGRELIFTDCTVNVAPDAAVLADIAKASSVSANILFGKVKLAMLSHSNGASGSGQSVDLVRDATAMVACDVVGPVQADAALNPAIALEKGVAGGDANVLVFPSLDASDIACKLAQELADAQAIGPVLQGLMQPVCDLPRGAMIEDIVAGTILTAALHNNRS